MTIDKALYINKRLGENVKCPKHNDDHPSAILNKTNIYCFACGKAFFFKGDDNRNIYNANANKANDYHNHLKQNSDDSEIKIYLKKRNILSDHVLKEFQLGFESEKNVIVFPIKNIDGDVNGFGFRNINDNQKSKYWNSLGKDKDDGIFEKSNNLYGIDKVTDKCEHLIICEGYICVISAFKNKFRDNVCFVATMGTALGEKHLQLLRHIKKTKDIKKISLMFDSDDAGRDATLRAIKVLLEGDIFPNIIANLTKDTNGVADYKDIDELLQKDSGQQYLKTLINENCYDFLDYLLKIETPNEEIKNYITECIKDKKKKSEYATKLCATRGLYNDLKLGRCHYNNILSLDEKAAKDYFCREESFFNHKLPKYFKFSEILVWAKNKVELLNKSGFPFKNFRKLENTNYKILGNKNGDYAWRQYQIINPILYIKLVDIVCNNWEEIKSYFGEKPLNINCASIPVFKDIDDKFVNNAARQIINWWDGMEQDSIKKSLKYKYIIHTDIVDCYGSIYTHSIPWALHTKQRIKQLMEEMKGNTEVAKNAKMEYDNLLGNQIDRLIQNMSHGQTNGIPQGSVLMDFIAEILLHHIDKELENKIMQDDEQSGIKTDFCILRYRDDYRIFANEIGIAKKVLKYLSEVLVENGGMRLSSEKTETSNCVVSSSIKKDKLHYFESFKDHESIRKNILNIYLFSRKFPNSGSIMKLLKSFENLISIKIDQISLALLQNENEHGAHDFDPWYVISILSEIMYRNPRTYSLACSIIHSMLSIMQSNDRKDIIKNISEKMSDVPNSELLCIWLERMTYLDKNDTEGWHDFYLRCETNKSLLYRQYKKQLLWDFDAQIDVSDIPLIIDHEIMDVFDKAHKKLIQSDNINHNILGKWTEDEADVFANYLSY